MRAHHGKIRLEVFRHVIHLPLSIVTKQGPAEFTSRINNDVSSLNSGFEALTSKTISQLTKGAAAFGAAIYFDWRLVFVSCTVGPLLAIVLRKTGKSIRKGTRGALEAQESLLRTTQESMQGLRTMKGSTAELESIRRFAFLITKFCAKICACEKRARCRDRLLKCWPSLSWRAWRSLPQKYFERRIVI